MKCPDASVVAASRASTGDGLPLKGVGSRAGGQSVPPCRWYLLLGARGHSPCCSLLTSAHPHPGMVTKQSEVGRYKAIDPGHHPNLYNREEDQGRVTAPGTPGGGAPPRPATTDGALRGVNTPTNDHLPTNDYNCPPSSSFSTSTVGSPGTKTEVVGEGRTVSPHTLMVSMWDTQTELAPRP